MARRYLRAAAWIACSVLLVLLVPSSAWSATDVPGRSASSSQPSPECGQPSGDPTSDSQSEDSPDPSPQSSPEPQPEDCTTSTPEPSPELPAAPSESPESSMMLAEGTCSIETPCVVSQDADSQAWMGLAAIWLCLCAGALVVSTWGNSGD